MAMASNLITHSVINSQKKSHVVCTKQQSTVGILLNFAWADETQFDPHGVLYCASDYGGYNEIAKFELSPVYDDNTRDLTNFASKNGNDVFESACIQSGSKINCKHRSGFRVYKVSMDFRTLRKMYDPFTDELEGYSVDATIRKTASRKWGAVCRQYIK